MSLASRLLPSAMSVMSTGVEAVTTFATEHAATICTTAAAASLWSNSDRDTCSPPDTASTDAAGSQTPEPGDQQALKSSDTESGNSGSGDEPLEDSCEQEAHDPVLAKKRAKLDALKRSVMMNAGLYVALEAANALVQGAVQGRFRQPQAP
jgi:hypothetical protein